MAGGPDEPQEHRYVLVVAMLIVLAVVLSLVGH
jgi:hypothetical protein